MTPTAKLATSKKIEAMKATSATNLWGGIQAGLRLFEDGTRDGDGKMPALMVLTDGMPNHMCPAQGYVPKLRAMGNLSSLPTIHTFGFGYSLKSGLLKSIAEVGGGNYSFIPDAGIIVSHRNSLFDITHANSPRVPSSSTQ